MSIRKENYASMAEYFEALAENARLFARALKKRNPVEAFYWFKKAKYYEKLARDQRKIYGD